MQRLFPWLAVTVAVLGAILTGCAQGAVTSPTAPSPSGTPMSATPTASTSVATAPTPSPTPPEPASWYPWLPAADTTVDGALRVDSFVRTLADVVPVSGSPGAASYRFDTGDPDPAKHPVMGISQGVVLVVLHGPVMVEDRAWYYLSPAQISVDIPTGWSPIVSPTGSRYYQPIAFDCPADPIAVAELSSLMLTDGLPACYGDDEVTIVGDLLCEPGPDVIAEGATWLAAGACRFDSPPTVYGLDPTLEPGRYAVTGRFMDDEARACRPRDADESAEGRIDAVLFCRRAFVATSAVRVAG